MEGTQKTVHFKTFGCQMNVYDTDRMRATLARSGLKPASDLRSADVIVINTCSIRDKAEQKVLSLVGELKVLKDKDPSKVIAVAGCAGQRMGRRLLQRAPHVDLVMGPDSVERISELIHSVLSEGRRILDTKLDDSGRGYAQKFATTGGRPSEYVTIMKGCDHFCSYCIVPFVRGREKSRIKTEILEEVRRLVDLGTKEIVFLGQNINTYGKGSGETLAQLIEETNEVSGLERIRYVTSHPKDLGEDLISQFASIEKLCPALHLPFQSGSDTILKRMCRLYTQKEYLSRIEKLKNLRPDIALSTDVIVGFPGESDADFEQTLNVLQEVQFSGVFLFKYSVRPGTKAVSFGDTVCESTKDQRLQWAQEVAYSYVLKENQAFVGQIVPTLIESLDKKKQAFSGRTPHNKLVHVLNVREASIGKTLSVEIVEANASNLKGYYVGAPRDRFKNDVSTPIQSAQN